MAWVREPTAVTRKSTASRSFGARATSVRSARWFAGKIVTGWGMEASEVQAVVGELAANAYLHARSPFTVSLSASDGLCRVEVFDRSGTMPTRKPSPSGEPTAGPDGDRPGGRGLVLVEALSARWGARAVTGGKIVWADMRPLRRGG